MLGPLLFILNTSESLELVKNRLYAYADGSTLLAVVRKLAVRPTVADSHNRQGLGYDSGVVQSLVHDTES